MAGAYHLYLPSGFPADLSGFLESKSFQVITKPKKLASGIWGSDHVISRNGASIGILEAPASAACEMRFLLCLAKPKALALLREVVSVLESYGALHQPD